METYSRERRREEEYGCGDVVFVFMGSKPLSKAVVIQDLRGNKLDSAHVEVEAEAEAKEGRLRIWYAFGGKRTYWVRPERLVKVLGCTYSPELGIVANQTTVLQIVVPETDEYRRLAYSQVLKDDTAVEIGCDLGKTVKILSKTCSNVVGIDKSIQSVRTAERECGEIENVKILHGDVLQNPGILTPFAEYTAVVFIDINGNRDIKDVEACLYLVRCTFVKARLIVVKSRYLYAKMDSSSSQ